jgi:hypothetical protein
MNTIENLWREYLRAEYGAALPPETQVAAQRHAFFTGAWCQWVFSRKIRDLDPASARAVNDAIELELARAVCAPQSNLEATTVRRLAA